MNKFRRASLAGLAMLALPLAGLSQAATDPHDHAHADAATSQDTKKSAPDAARGHEHAHGHGHADETALVRRLELDQGKRWPTDESLRSGMASVRTAFDADHPAIHSGRQTDAQYEALAGRIQTAVDRIVAECRLPPAADAQLHYVVGDLLQGVGWMRGSDPERSRHDGAARVHGALRAYGKFFDDPTWREEPGKHAHGNH